MLRPQILLIANERDFTTDLVIAELRRRGAAYCRLNIEDVSRDRIAFDPGEPRLTIISEASEFELSPVSLRSIYFRGPVWLRNHSPEDIHPDRLLRRTQGWACLRSMMTFSDVRWINHPTATYRAEHKILQLNLARRLGFSVPTTVVTNDPKLAVVKIGSRQLAVKSLDTFLFVQDQEEGFVFTQIEEASKLIECDFSAAPAIFQEVLEPKVDIRVTVVGSFVHAVEIRKDGHGIKGDWRKTQRELQFARVVLSPSTQDKCLKLVRELGLTFGAIDLARVADTDYFIEINPTGEWAWLVDSAHLPIAENLVDLLSESEQ